MSRNTGSTKAAEELGRMVGVSSDLSDRQRARSAPLRGSCGPSGARTHDPGKPGGSNTDVAADDQVLFDQAFFGGEDDEKASGGA